MPSYDQFCLALLSPDGTAVRYVPDLGFDAFDGTLERYGGHGSGSVSFNAEVSALASVTEGDCVEAWYAGVLRYRGYVEDVTRTEGEPPRVRLTLNGVSFQAGMQEVQGQYLYPEPVDVSVAFADVTREAITPGLPALTVQAQTVGATIDQLDGTYRQAGAVFNDLITGSSENLAVWGGDVDLDPASPTYLADRLYIRPVSAKADYAVEVPGARTTAGELTTSLADVRNRLRIMGGPPKYPNLLYNGSFERLRFAGPDSGNLLLNASFEANGGGTDGLADHWTITGGAFVHAASDGTGAAYQGDRLLKIDVGGQATQIHNTAGTVTPGTPYTVGVYAARESGAATGVGRLTLQWLGAGGSVTVPVNPASTTYEVFDTTQVAPDGATGLQVTLDLSTVVGAGSGIKFDEAFAFDASTVFADKWELYTFGDAGVTLQNWRARGAYDGLRCLLCHVTASDTDGHDAHLRPAAGERTAITPRQTLVLSCRLKGAWPKLLLQIEEYKADGSFNMVTAHAVAPGSSATWALQSMSKTLDSATTHVHAYLTFRGSTTGDLYVDAMSLRDAAAPAGEFVRDGNFTAVFDSDDPRLVGVSANAVNSRTLYTGGVPRYEQVSSDLITTLADAETYAAAWFNAHAVPLPQAPVTVVDDPRAFAPGQGVRLTGADGPTLMAGRDFLPVMRVRLSFGSDGLWRQGIEIQQEVKDAAEEILAWLSRKARLTALGSATSTTGGTSTGVSPPINGPLAVTDGTLTVHNVDLLRLTEGVLSSAGTGEADWFPQDADATHKGVTTLSHDFGGTAAAPEVVGIRMIPVTDAAPADGQGLVYRASGSDIEWGDVGGDAIIPVAALPPPGPDTETHFYRLTTFSGGGAVGGDAGGGSSSGGAGNASKEWDFATGLSGFTDSGLGGSDPLPLSWVSGDAGLGAGCIHWATSGTLAAGTTGDVASLTGTWESWGVPAGATVTAVRLSGFNYRVAAHAGLSSWSLSVGLTPHGQPALPALATLEDTSFPSAWSAFPTETWVTVPPAARAPSTALDLSLAVSAALAGGSTDVDLRLDTLRLDFQYTGAETFDPSLYTLNGDAALVGGEVRLTGGGSQAGSAFLTTPEPVASFSKSFWIRSELGTGLGGGWADGFVFTVQADPAGPHALGMAGGSFGGDLGWQGILHSVGVKFDKFRNTSTHDPLQVGGADDPSDNCTGLFLNGAVPQGGADLTPTGLDLKTADKLHVTADYDGATLTVTVTDSGTGASATAAYAVDIPGTLGSRTGYFGWTAATDEEWSSQFLTTPGTGTGGTLTGGGAGPGGPAHETVWYSEKLADGTYRWVQVPDGDTSSGSGATPGSVTVPAPTLPGQILFSLDGATARWVLPLTDPDFGWLITDDGEMMVAE